MKINLPHHTYARGMSCTQTFMSHVRNVYASPIFHVNEYVERDEAHMSLGLVHFTHVIVSHVSYTYDMRMRCVIHVKTLNPKP